MKRLQKIGLLVALAGNGAAHADAVAQGTAIYNQTCIACHGANGKSPIPGIPSLNDPKGPLNKSDDVLFRSIRDGMQRPGAAMTMPAKGGNPAISDQDIEAVIRYLRSAFQS
ncbi:MAG: cytochrome c [Pseudomonadales bacterium]